MRNHMLHLEEILALQEGERVVSILRRSLFTVAPILIAATLFLAAPFFFLFPLLRMGFIGTVLLCASFAIGAYLGLKGVLLWDANVLVLTDRRFLVVRQNGLWSRRVVEAPLAGSQATVKRSGWLGALRIGELTLTGHGLSVPVVVSGMPSAEKVARNIQGLRDAQSAGFKVRTV